VFPKFVSVIAATASLVAYGAIAQPTDTVALLKELEAIKKKQAEEMAQNLSNLAKQVAMASQSDTSATQYYTEAVCSLEFVSDANGFREWKKNRKDALSSKVVQAAIKLHLHYLVFSLNAAAKPEELPPVDELTAYLVELAKVESAAGWGIYRPDPRNPTDQMIHELLLEPLADGAVAKACKVSAELQSLSGEDPNSSKWAAKAGDWNGILDTNLKAPLRQHKDPRLLNMWQLQIEYEKERSNGNRGDATDYTSIKLPRMMWGEATDMLVLGKTDQGVAEMTRIIRTYPQHPDLSSWVDGLTIVLKAMAPQQSAPSPAAPAHS